MVNSPTDYNVLIVGAGPNGLAAAIRLAQAGARVKVFESHDTIGGGTRSAELTLNGYLHDVCSAIHPLSLASPFFQKLPLNSFGLDYIHPPFPLAHPLDGGGAVVLKRSLVETAMGMDQDGSAYLKLMRPLVRDWKRLMADTFRPLPLPPRHPLTLVRFGLPAIHSAMGLAQSRFRGTRARALLAGLCAHSILPLDRMLTASFGLLLGLLAHAVGWPMVRGGSQRIADALGAMLHSMGGQISTGSKVTSLQDLPASRAVLLNLSPRGLLEVGGERLPPAYRSQLERYRYGPGVCKVDWALEEPIPWEAQEARQAGSVHVGGTMAEINLAEAQVWEGEHPQHPFVLLAQQSPFDPSRAPQGKHTAWGYCHVPAGSDRDVSDRIEAQIERFAPGFVNRILDRHVMTAVDMEAHNPNYVGGDINGGVQDLRQLYSRPALLLNPYRIPTIGSEAHPGLYLCSASTPPGGGVHGMCGYHAAETVLKDLRR